MNLNAAERWPQGIATYHVVVQVNFHEDLRVDFATGVGRAAVDSGQVQHDSNTAEQRPKQRDATLLAKLVNYGTSMF